MVIPRSACVWAFVDAMNAHPYLLELSAKGWHIGTSHASELSFDQQIIGAGRLLSWVRMKLREDVEVEEARSNVFSTRRGDVPPPGFAGSDLKGLGDRLPSFDGKPVFAR